MFQRALPATLSLGILSLPSAAYAQLITVTAQDRYLEGSTTSVNFGVPSESGVQRVDPPFGDYGAWQQTHDVFGNMIATGTQHGGFNGSDRFDIERFTMNISGGGGPDQSGTGAYTNKFAYTFTANEPINYAMNGQFFIGENVTIVMSLTGPSTNVTQTSSGDNLTIANTTGTLQPGSYNLSILATGSGAFTGPGGFGTGIGGPEPMFSFVATPATVTCPADLANAAGEGTPDGGVDINDLLFFLSAFEAGSEDADLDNDGDPATGTPDGGVDVNDLLFFLARFEAGC